MLMHATLRQERYSDHWGQLQDHIRELHSFLSSHAAPDALGSASAAPSTSEARVGLANERRQLLDAYLHRLSSSCAAIQLRLPSLPPHPLPLHTHDVYLPLNATLSTTAAAPQQVFAMLREQQHLLLIGPDGAGKTTTINQLARVMAAAISDGKPGEWMRRLEGWHRGPRLPVRVQLTQAVAQYTGAPLEALWAAVPELAQGHLTRHERAVLQSTLAHTLERGQGVLLLDELDGLLDGPQRNAAQHILETARAHYGASFILAAYRGDAACGAAEQYPGWAQALLAPLTPYQTAALVARWYEALAQLGHYHADDAQQRAQKLGATIGVSQQLAQLAKRPGWLGALIALHADNGQLPPQLVKQAWQDVLAAPGAP
jgi:energy-coupling factor transporter ATP-binding protein EcfA2